MKKILNKIPMGKSSTGKNPKNSTVGKKTAKRTSEISKESPWLEDYLDCFHFKYKPVTEAFLHRISKELIEWASTHEKNYTIKGFFQEKGINESTCYQWVKKYPLFKEAVEFAKSIIGDRREHGALERRLDAGMVSYMMPHYSQDWKSMLKERTELKAQANENANTGTQFVVMEKYSTDSKKNDTDDSGSSTTSSKTLESKTPESKTPESKTQVSKTPEEVATESTDMGRERLRQIRKNMIK